MITGKDESVTRCALTALTHYASLFLQGIQN